MRPHPSRFCPRAPRAPAALGALAAVAGLVGLAALPALAQEGPLTAQEFDAYTTGKTLYYGTGAAPYGAEEYRAGRRVVWSFLDGECLEGSWYADEAGRICFVYEDGTGPQCWRFYRGTGGLRAEFGEDAAPLYEARQGEEPLICLGPRVGV